MNLEKNELPDAAKNARELAEQPEVKQALQQTPHSTSKKSRSKLNDAFIAGIYGLVLTGFLAAHFFSPFFLPSNFKHRALVENVFLGGVFVGATLVAVKLIQIFLVSRVSSSVTRFNLTRILHFVAGLTVLFIAAATLLNDWRATLASLGLLSLILGFALQTPISSFIGWIYILTRRPYRVGDRVKIGDAKGDVIDVSYLDTTLWEFGGDYLSTDHPSGRVIKFPNSNVLNVPVWNYSWPLFPYIWNEIKFNIAYESDLSFVSATMERIAEEEIGEDMRKNIPIFRELLRETPVDHLDVRERPAVFFRVSENTWLEATVRYLVDPKKAGRVKSALIPKLIRTLSASPDKVMFPKSNAR